MATSNRAPENVTTQNQKLFTILKQKFRDQKYFIPAAKKLGDWLKNEKAYYTEARTEIVAILLTAQEMLREWSKPTEASESSELRASEPHPEPTDPTDFHESACTNRPMADAYVQLILSMAPFQERFVELDLQASIGKLLASVTPQQPSTSPPQNIPSDPMHTALPSNIIDPSQQMHPSSSSLALALTEPDPRVSVKESPETATPLIPITQPRLVVPGITIPASNISNTSAPTLVEPSSKPKRKKRKKDDISKLIELDVQLYRQKKPVEVAQTTNSPPGNMEIPRGADPSSAAPPISSPSVAAINPQQTYAATNAASASAVISSENIVTSAVHEAVLRIESDSEAIAHPQEIHSRHPDVLIGTQEQSEDVEMPPLPYQNVLDTSNAQHSNHSAAPEVLSHAMEVEVDRVLHKLTGTGPSVEMIVPTPKKNPHPKITNVDPFAESDEPIHPVSSSIPEGRPLQPLTASSHITAMQGIVDTPRTHTSNTGIQAEASTAEPPLDGPAVFQAMIRTVVNDTNQLIASSIDPSAPPHLLSSEDSSLPTSPTAEQSPHSKASYLEDNTPSTSTGIKTATVIARHRGLASGTMSVDFSISQKQLDSITNWRSKRSDNLEETLCITLLCFLAADVRARLESSESRDLRTILPYLECSWPTNGGLTMNALWNGQCIDFPLSPPFALPSNGLVDVSQFLVSGQNTLRFKQTQNMTDYWLILCAHHPTPSQLNAVARRHHKERNWTGWLDKISRPLQLPFKIPIEV